jgi:hypothetical protein
MLFYPSMKFFIVLLIACLLSACCTKIQCVGADFITDISFFKFRPADLDSIAVSSFAKNTNFAIKIDSLITNAKQRYFGDTIYYAFMGKSLNLDADYRVIVLKTRQQFLIRDFDLRKEKCNTGFLCSDNYQVLVSYIVNGRRETPFDLSLKISN